MKYIDLLSDFGFKRLFGTEANKDLLIDFLNQLLPKDHLIYDLTYLATEHIGDIKEDRIAFFDIHCKTKKGDHFIVELQRIKQTNFQDRCLFYASKVIQQQAPKGNWDFELMPVYTIGILDFILEGNEDTQGLVHRIALRDEKGMLFSSKMSYIYIELPKFTKVLEELETHFEKWLFVFRWLSKLDKRPPALKERVFQKIFKIANIANFTVMERSQYEISLKIRRDNQNAMDYLKKKALKEGREEGIEKGREEGREEGRDKERLATLKSSLNAGFSLEVIAQILRMDLEELTSLAQENDLI